jgi:hypothetical protein
MNFRTIITSAATAIICLCGTAQAATIDLSVPKTYGTTAFWTLTKTFVLPSGFSNAVLDIDLLAADDRVVMLLNDAIVASEGIFGPGTGSMVLTEGGPTETFTFDYGNLTTDFASITAGFVEGVNTLEFIVNNTNSGIYGGLVTPGGGDVNNLTFTGTLSYEAPSGVVPLPATLPLLLAGLAGLSVVARRPGGGAGGTA